MTYPYNDDQRSNSINNPFLSSPQGGLGSQYDPNGLAASPSYGTDPVADYGYNPAASPQQPVSGYDYGVPQPQYGVPEPQYGVMPYAQPMPANVPIGGMQQKDKAVALLLCIFFGWLGVHNFYTGFSGVGAAQLVLTLLGWVFVWVFIGVPLLFAVGIWVLVDFIMIIANGGRFAYVFRS